MLRDRTARVSVKRVCRPAESNYDRCRSLHSLHGNACKLLFVKCNIVVSDKGNETHRKSRSNLPRCRPYRPARHGSVGKAYRLTKAAAYRNSVAVPIQFDEMSQWKDTGSASKCNLAANESSFIIHNSTIVRLVSWTFFNYYLCASSSFLSKRSIVYWSDM